MRSIKITMQMDLLRCKTPELVRKEIWTHVLAYNLIRTIMAQTASQEGIAPRSISFKPDRACVDNDDIAAVSRDQSLHEDHRQVVACPCSVADDRDTPVQIETTARADRKAFRRIATR